MSLRSVFSRLLSSRSRSQLADSHSVSRDLDNRSADNKPPRPTWRHRLVIFLIAITILLSAVWLLLAIWYQYGISSVLTWLATIIIVGILAALLGTRYWHTVTKILLSVSSTGRTSIIKNSVGKNTSLKNTAPKNIALKNTATRYLIGLYGATWLIGLGWFFSIEPQQDRDWMAEVDQQVSYERDATNPDLITLTNVRNFDWRTDEDATEHWETRTIDLSKLSGVDVTNSYWMGPLIAHTLVSFRFEDDRPLAFSFEIRKENGESFSALAGFFRRYELSLIAAEERDIIYTRSNARGEQVYLFPISNLQQHEVRALFESYLTAIDELNNKPAWYNTLTSNCTNIIFYMARIVSGDRLPWDYRIWVSGWLPNYLYDVGMLDAAPTKDNQPWSMDTWYERTHINPKTLGFDNLHSIANSRQFSRQIRQDIPIPLLADSQSSAEAKAKSAAQSSY
ncbi:DUF4105 domain-containing protein [Psychrobacter sp. Ps6]|uniref:Lnb N-terminal periplasmic domain-containing protein n=1 Tax=Psychrobacter sp. Ps6 TaxID=2790960 RepID=UPI001EDF91C4|nr:DUF4105 domain-containing protein [Psychrobacter sp. Ps6]MCG3879791.1 DUF4105 domain-containing protein [Psychrobacter sp. Ps6]